MSRTDHHRRVRQLRAGNPARRKVDVQDAVRKGVLKTDVRDANGFPDYSRNVTVWAKPGVRKAYQRATHRRDRSDRRSALATTAYQRDPALRQALRIERELTPVVRRSVNGDMT